MNQFDNLITTISRVANREILKMIADLATDISKTDDVALLDGPRALRCFADALRERANNIT